MIAQLETPMSAPVKVSEWRPTQFGDAPLGCVFPDFADWTIVRVTKPGADYPYKKPGQEILTVRHWAGRFHVVVQLPKSDTPTEAAS